MGLVLISVQTAERRQLTRPSVEYDDFSPAFSPDMRRLAFVRYSSVGASAGDLYLLKLSSELAPAGQLERLTSFHHQIASPVWTANGRSLLFVRHEAGIPALWRIETGGGRHIEPLLIAADNSLTMTASPSGNRTVYTREGEDVNIWAVNLSHGHVGQCIRPQIASSWTEDNPQFSPDGREIAFQSSRSGTMDFGYVTATVRIPISSLI
jgi:Tol biopolymer transport system component